jgi:RNA polymerase sigma factor (sigma-70 family)
MADTPLAPVVRHIRKLARGSSTNERTDAGLLEQFLRRGDQDAFAALVRRHGRLVWRVCSRVLGQVHTAEEAYQATFLVLARRAAKVRKPAALASWLYSVAYRIARQARADIVRQQSRPGEPMARPPVDPAREAACRELESIVVEEVHALPAKYRLPILLCYWEGLTNEEAARRLAWPAGTVKTRLLRARQLLHKRLTRRGVSLPLGVLATLLAAGGGDAATPTALATASAGALAEQAIRAMACVKAKVVVALLLAAGAVAAGVGALTPPKPPARPNGETPKAEQPQVQAEPANLRTDRYGDPLPPGAIARLGTVRFRHPFWVGGLAFTPDGKTLASACWDGTVRLWDAATGKETRCFRRRPNPIPGWGQVVFNDVAISPDGKALVAVDNHDTAYIWDLGSGKELHRLKEGKNNNFGFALSADGKTLAVSDGGGEVKLWDLATGKVMRVLRAAPRPAAVLAFSPDGKILAAGDNAPIPVGAAKVKDGASSIRLWDTAAGRPLRELKGHTGGVTTVAFSPDGRTLVSASHDATLRFWDPAAGKQVRKIQVPDATPADEEQDRQKGIHYGGVLTVAYSPDGRLLASGSYDGTVRLWDAGTGKELYALRGHGREVAGVVFSPDGKTLASGSRDHTIRLWDPASGKQLQPRQGHDGPVNNLAVSPDGRIAAAVCHDGTIRLWSLTAKRQLHVLRGHTDFVYAAAFSPDGHILASASADRTVRLWDAATGRELRQLGKHRGAVYSVAFTSVRNMLLSGEANSTLHFWDATTGEELRQLPEVYSFHDFRLSSDGTILATAARNAVHLLDVKTGKELRRFDGSWPRLGLSPDGRMLAMQKSGDKIRLWNAATGEELGALADSDSPPGYVGVMSYVFSPDGRLLARIGKGDIELWEVLSGKLRRHFRGHQAGIGPFAFSPDGQTLLSGSNDTTVLIWDVARRQEMRPGRLGEKELQELWDALAGGDAEKADRAICTLAAAAEQSVPFLERHLRPVKIADEERLARLIADLDSDQFAVREQAARKLEQLREHAETALRQALKKSPSLEARRRMERLLGKLRELPLAPDLLRVLRAVEVFERIDAPEARQLLEKLAKGAAEARLTREAKASLQRLDRRGASQPR